MKDHRALRLVGGQEGPRTVSASSLEVHSLPDAEAAVSYLLVCERTRAAAVVNPRPSTAVELSGLLAGLRLRFVLATSAEDGRVETRQERYQHLLAGLGLQAPATALGGEVPWAAVPRVGPVLGPSAPSGDETLVEGASLMFRLQSPATCATSYTLGTGATPGSSNAPVVVGRLRVALGAFHLEVVPSGKGDGRVCFLVQDRLFIPGALAPVGQPTQLSPRFLDLPPDCLVYPSRFGQTLPLSSVGYERRRPASR